MYLAYLLETCIKNVPGDVMIVIEKYLLMESIKIMSSLKEKFLNATALLFFFILVSIHFNVLNKIRLSVITLIS